MAEQFNFNISLSVLDHLGRNLYRNFITVLGEAISNSWDAEAKNVWIEIYEGKGSFSIKDDGIGMNRDDFQNKFLKIGYSKRKAGESLSPNKKRPYIGRKGIGKLALLSCAQRIHIASKTSDTDYIGGIIDNNTLDEAITDDLNPEKCPLETLDENVFRNLKKDHEHGTIIYFENTNAGINNNIKTLRRLIALYFRFSLVDPSFSIFVNDDDPNSEDLKKVTYKDLEDLSNNTEFLWTINEFSDPFLKILDFKEKLDIDIINKNIKGFIASVEKPKKLNIFGVSEKTGVDVFVNGRLRETNILRHMPSYATRHIASYIYGQIHLDTLDDANSDNNEDRFTSSREGIKPEDNLYKDLLETIKDDILEKISNQWDDMRRARKQDGDPDNETIPKYERRLEESKNALDEIVKKQIDDSENLKDSTKTKLKETLLKLSYDNTRIYQDLFVLENLLRTFLKENDISDEDDLPTDEVFKDCLKKLKATMRSRAEDEEGHSLQDNIFEDPHVLDYFDLICLGILTDIVNKKTPGRYITQTMEAHTKDIAPIRNAIMHTNKVSDRVMYDGKIKSVIRLVDKLRDNPKP